MSGVGSFATAAVETADAKEATVNNSSKDRNPRTWIDKRGSQGKFDAVPGLESNRGGNGQEGEPDITAGQKMLAACSGSLFTSLLVTPLDVVRVRLQSQQPPSPKNAAVNFSSLTSPLRAHKLPLTPLQFQSMTHLSTPELGITACCREVFWINNTPEACMVPTSSPSAGTILNDSCVVEEASRRRFHGTWEGLVKIARYEGVSSLWRGLSPTLLMAVPSNVIYFTGYDTLRTSAWSPFTHFGVVWGPLIAGSAARAIAATAISPIEMFKTRLQAVSNTHLNSSKGIFRATFDTTKNMVAKEGVKSLWRGLELTLWRDVPFSGVYWLGYETIKSFIRSEREREWHLSSLHLHHPTKRHVKKDLHSESTFTDSFIAGAVSGAVAAFVTQPFDVGKTRRQISAHAGIETKGDMPKVLYNIFKAEGASGLWRGCVPRILKVSPACAIMISSYEVGKKAARKMNEQREI
ncbi:mitochondrial carrier domain-containing protein [Tuber borchii]|uniref:Mitochondrial carrier domain-containing protein n=1 Tax=Tuber borchii TaxID=42251 RepID=A0A2T6ZMA2_TUBBO|nr:mitochondrial carrier domain-containing protein [Tuber borchii]